MYIPLFADNLVNQAFFFFFFFAPPLVKLEPHVSTNYQPVVMMIVVVVMASPCRYICCTSEHASPLHPSPVAKPNLSSSLSRYSWTLAKVHDLTDFPHVFSADSGIRQI